MGLGHPTASNGARDRVGAPLPAITCRRLGGAKAAAAQLETSPLSRRLGFGESAYARARENIQTQMRVPACSLRNYRVLLSGTLPVELDDVPEPLGVVAPPEAPPTRPQCSYGLAARALSPRSLCVRITRRP
jgi:hypothetical protein